MSLSIEQIRVIQQPYTNQIRLGISSYKPAPNFTTLQSLDKVTYMQPKTYRARQNLMNETLGVPIYKSTGMPIPIRHISNQLIGQNVAQQNAEYLNENI